MSNNDLRCSKCGSQHHPVECPKDKEMTTPELLNCPFCGCDVRILNAKEEPYYETWRWRISGRHLRGCIFEFINIGLYTTKEYAREAWNRRVK